MKNKIKQYTIKEIIDNPSLLLNKFTFCRKSYVEGDVTNLIYFSHIKNDQFFCYFYRNDEYDPNKKIKQFFDTSFITSEESDIDDFFRVYCTTDYPVITLF